MGDGKAGERARKGRKGGRLGGDLKRDKVEGDLWENEKGSWGGQGNGLKKAGKEDKKIREGG